MKTTQEFRDEVHWLARNILSEYADEVHTEFDIPEPGEPENDLATVTVEMPQGETFAVPFCIHEHKTVIVGDRDTDIYLHADPAGLYAWLFLTCLMRLRDARA